MIIIFIIIINQTYDLHHTYMTPTTTTTIIIIITILMDGHRSRVLNSLARAHTDKHVYNTQMHTPIIQRDSIGYGYQLE